MITVCIFAKAPRPGAVKTRLAVAIGAHAAAALATAFVEDAWALACSRSWARPVIAAAGELPRELIDRLPDAFVWDQGDGALGARIERVLARAGGAAIALGADSPGLPGDVLDEAARHLADGRAVLGPADDGGFYLLGVPRCPPGLLEGVTWSAASTCAEVAARLTASGLELAWVAPWFDIDRVDDLARLAALVARHPDRAPATAHALDALGRPLADRRGLDAMDRPLADRTGLDATDPRVSIAAVMPALDEARRIGAAVDAVLAAGIDEIVVADGGSRDDTVAIARGRGARVIAAPRGRARQQNAGAAATRATALVFVHADCLVPPDAGAWIRATLADERVAAGAFRTRTRFDGAGRAPRRARLLWLADVRGRRGRLPYGDQAIFVRRDVFAAIGGFPDQPLLEDLALSRRLRRLGEVRVVPREVTVSGRRFLAHPVRATLACHLFPLLAELGVSPARLARCWSAVR